MNFSDRRVPDILDHRSNGTYDSVRSSVFGTDAIIQPGRDVSNDSSTYFTATQLQQNNPVGEHGGRQTLTCLKTRKCMLILIAAVFLMFIFIVGLAVTIVILHRKGPETEPMVTDQQIGSGSKTTNVPTTTTAATTNLTSEETETHDNRTSYTNVTVATTTRPTTSTMLSTIGSGSKTTNVPTTTTAAATTNLTSEETETHDHTTIYTNVTVATTTGHTTPTLLSTMTSERKTTTQTTTITTGIKTTIETTVESTSNSNTTQNCVRKCHMCSSFNSRCPANGNITGNDPGEVGNCPCDTTCFSEIRRWSGVQRGCTKDFPNWDETSRQNKTCQEINDSFVCFCLGDRCNKHDMTGYPQYEG